SHKGQAYWEILNNLSDNFNNSIAKCSKNTSENKKNNFDGNYVDEDEALDYTIKIEEFAFEHYDYNLHASKPVQISSIDVRSILIQKLPQFPDVTYSEFMKLILTYHLSDSAENDILK
ncbi:14451_t:CDS:2, partial [Funneliformis mosseae]